MEEGRIDSASLGPPIIQLFDIGVSEDEVMLSQSQFLLLSSVQSKNLKGFIKGYMGGLKV